VPAPGLPMVETIAVVIFVALLVFGATRVPSIGDAVGRAVSRLFHKE
jgi:Sec-independent protein translocase protein TatA